MARGTALTRTRAKVATGSMAFEMAKAIATDTDNGRELYQFALKVFRDPTFAFEDRKWAMEWLADRGAGKAHATLDVNTSHTETVRIDLSAYTLEELDELERINAAAKARQLANEMKVIDVPTSDSP